MKKHLSVLPLIIIVSLVFACKVPFNNTAKSTEVEVAVTCPFKGMESMAKSLISDEAIMSVTVTAENSSGTILGTATLTKGTSSWTGSMIVTVSESVTITFKARGWSEAGGAGSMLYYGKSDVMVTNSDTSLSVTIGTVLQTITAQWARSTDSSSTSTHFNGVAADGSGNIYSVGYQGSGTVTHGLGVTATGSGSIQNALLVKYDSSGVTQWARTVSTGSSNSVFYGVTTDSSGNVYTVGCQSGTGTYTYGSGVSATGASSSSNVVVVKYDSSGTALWARTMRSAGGLSIFFGVAVDDSGNVYAVGGQNGTIAYYYGTGVSATGVDTGNAVIVKYNASGTAQWARTVSAGSDISQFNGVTVDGSGNIYAVGYQVGWGSFTYGTGVSTHGHCPSYPNIVIVKYNASGTAQWARSTSVGQAPSQFNSIAVDGSGNVYAAGIQSGIVEVGYGTGVSAKSYNGTMDNVLVVKYDASGTAQWARTMTRTGYETWIYNQFLSVAVDALGNVYAAGWQLAGHTYTYGTGVTATATDGYESSSYASYNPLLVKYDTSGTTLWAKTLSSGTGSRFTGVTHDASGNVYAVGYQDASQLEGNYCTYDSGVSIMRLGYESEVLVKY